MIIYYKENKGDSQFNFRFMFLHTFVIHLIGTQIVSQVKSRGMSLQINGQRCYIEEIKEKGVLSVCLHQRG